MCLSMFAVVVALSLANYAILSRASCPSADYIACGDAGNGKVCNIGASVQEGYVSIGSNGKWNLIPFSNTDDVTLQIDCDEWLGEINSASKTCCYIAANNGFSDAEREYLGMKNEGVDAIIGTANYPQFTYSIRFGTANRYIYRVVNGAQTICHWKFFGDPANNNAKHCNWATSAPVTAHSSGDWTRCGDEGGSCTNLASTGAHWIRYGNPNKWLMRFIISNDGSIPCESNFFRADPDPGHLKHCERAPAQAITTTTTQPPPSDLYGRLAHQFAPIIHLFPFDTNRPSSVEQFFEIVNLKSKADDSIITSAVTGDIIGDEDGDSSYLDFKVDAPSGDNVYMTGNLADDVFVDAPLYCHITEDDETNTYRITYALFYPFNGFQTFRVNYEAGAFGLSDHTRNFEWARFARHTSDWEHAHIFVSKDTEQIQRVQISQHGDEEVGYPSEIETIGTRTVLYSAWNSHAFYFHEETRTLEDLGYEALLRVATDVNWIKIVDTTASGQETDHYMLPTDYNPNGVRVDAIHNDNLIVIKDENESEFPWLNFDGSWGPAVMDNSHIDHPPDIEGNIDYTLEYVILPFVPESKYEEYLTAGGARGPKTRNWWLDSTVYNHQCPSFEYVPCGDAGNGKVCNIDPTVQEGYVAIGSNGKWNLVPFSNTDGITLQIDCDEWLGEINSESKTCCYIAASNGFSTADRQYIGTQNEGVNAIIGTANYPEYTYSIRFGVSNRYIYRVVNGAQTICHWKFFGDPANNHAKHCNWARTAPVTEDSSAEWTLCGVEDGLCGGLEPQTQIWIRYGNPDKWLMRLIVSDDGTVPCESNFFRADPDPGNAKQCERAPAQLLSGQASNAIVNSDRMSDASGLSDLTDNNEPKAISLVLMIVFCVLCCAFGMCTLYLYQKRHWIWNGFRYRSLRNNTDNNSNNNDSKPQKYSTTATHEEGDAVDVLVIDEEDSDV